MEMENRGVCTNVQVAVAAVQVTALKVSSSESPYESAFRLQESMTSRVRLETEIERKH